MSIEWQRTARVTAVILRSWNPNGPWNCVSDCAADRVLDSVIYNTWHQVLARSHPAEWTLRYYRLSNSQYAHYLRPSLTYINTIICLTITLFMNITENRTEPKRSNQYLQRWSQRHEWIDKFDSVPCMDNGRRYSLSESTNISNRIILHFL